MRKILFLALGIFGLSVSALRAQELPAGDLSVGCSYVREGFSNGVRANGGTAALAGYVNRCVGITGDFGAYHASPFGIGANTGVSYRHSEQVAPFAQVPVGGAHVTAGACGEYSIEQIEWQLFGEEKMSWQRTARFRR